VGHKKLKIIQQGSRCCGVVIDDEGKKKKGKDKHRKKIENIKQPTNNNNNNTDLKSPDPQSQRSTFVDNEKKVKTIYRFSTFEE